MKRQERDSTQFARLRQPEIANFPNVIATTPRCFRDSRSPTTQCSTCRTENDENRRRQFGVRKIYWRPFFSPAWTLSSSIADFKWAGRMLRSLCSRRQMRPAMNVSQTTSWSSLFTDRLEYGVVQYVSMAWSAGRDRPYTVQLAVPNGNYVVGKRKGRY